eukprot:SAG22_NODE_1212_length_5155_cov_2.020767_2_plen_192_part_00
MMRLSLSLWRLPSGLGLRMRCPRWDTRVEKGGAHARISNAMLLAAMLVLLGARCTAGRQTCDEAFPHLGPPPPPPLGGVTVDLPAAPLPSGGSTSLVALLRSETISWWLYALNTLSNFVPCAMPWHCREDFLKEWDPDLFDWSGDRKYCTDLPLPLGGSHNHWLTAVALIRSALGRWGACALTWRGSSRGG